MLPFLDGYPRPKIKEINSLPLEMLVIKEPAIWLDKSILTWNLWTRIFPDKGFTQQRIVIYFILGYFQQKVITKFCENFVKAKKLYFELFFAHFRASKNFSGKPVFVTLQKRTELQKKLMRRFWEKLVTHVWTDACKERQAWIHRISLLRVQNSSKTVRKLMIKNLRSSLKVHEKSMKLKLF